MPKVIEQVRENALEEAKRIILSEGIRGITIRKVAINIGVAVGTVYNYFPSKEQLIKSAMHDDWHRMGEELTSQINQISEYTEDGILIGTKKIYEYIVKFTELYGDVFIEAGKMKESIDSHFEFHEIVIGFVKKHVIVLMNKFNPDMEDADISADLVAGSLLRYASKSDFEYAQLEPLLRKIFA